MRNAIIPEKLKELRKANGYTQDYVASYLGIVRQTYSHYETGKRTPNYDTIYKLAGLYNISVDDLIQLTVISEELEEYSYFIQAPKNEELSDYLDYLNNPRNSKKFHLLNRFEKELLYYFEKLTEEDRMEIIEFTKIKANKKR
ncbi:MAG: helix-turn-helix transcriptional regulator [Lachnospiraceae bacterium]|nr:helix-turn-helix transcriptional regulator [Lachnospiraceae bacterium]